MSNIFPKAFAGLIFLFLINASPVLAINTNYPDAPWGWGTNYNQDIPMDPRLDSRKINIPWNSLEPTNDSYRFDGIFNLVRDAIRQNKKILIGILLKENAQWSGCSGPSCLDGTPQWVVDIDPVIDTVDGRKMINYANPIVKQHIADITQDLLSALANQFPNESDRNHFAILVCPGMDCEAQPEQNPHDQAYINRWGGSDPNTAINNAIGVWNNYVKWLIDTYEEKMNLAGLENKTRYFSISATFKNPKLEKPVYLAHLSTKSNKWGLYAASISIGMENFRYAELHNPNEDEILDSNYDMQDILRKFCVNRPCLGEYGDAREGGNEETTWKHWWRAASALWQRLDGYYGRKTWMLDYGSLGKEFFDTYAGKTYNTTPRAWVVLHQDYQLIPNPYQYPQRNFTFYLDQFDSNLVDGKNALTTPEWSFCFNPNLEYPCSTKKNQIGHQIAKYNPLDDYRGIFTRLTYPGQIMAFRHIPDANGKTYISGGPHHIKIAITYLDHSSDTLSLKYDSTQGIKEAWKITKGNTNKWITKETELTDARFNQQIPGSADFYIDDNNDGDEYIHWASIESVSSHFSCPNGDLGNLDCDEEGKINQTDMNILLNSWAPSGPVPPPISGGHSSDLNTDGRVEETDLMILIKNWHL
jgi:hypothetical protein